MARGSFAPKPSMALPSSHWRRYRGVRWPGSDARIDEVVLGPTGVHVVLHRPGARVGGPEVRTAAHAAEAVGGLLPDRYRGRVRPEVLLEEETVDVATWDGEVLLASRGALEHTWRFASRELSTSEIAGIGRWLDARLELLRVEVPSPRRRGWLRRLRPRAVAR